VLYTTEPKKSK